MTVANLPHSSARSVLFKSRRKTVLWICFAAAAFIMVSALGFYFVSVNWPYRYRKIKPLLENVLASQVAISRYHRTYFPYPGFVATGITLRRKSAPHQPPLGSAETLVVQGRWIDLFLLRERVQLVDITGLHIVVPPIGGQANHEDFPPGSTADFSGPATEIENLNLHKSVLDIMHNDGSRLSFPIKELKIVDLRKGRALTYLVDMQNAKPAGRIWATGKFGPLNAKNLGGTPVSGDFTFSSVNLHDIGDIRGTLSSGGNFNGTMAAMEAKATSTTPDFAVDDARPARVDASIQCTVNGLNGELAIHSIEAKIGATTIRVAGTIKGAPKLTNLDLQVTGGRVEDLLRPFFHDEVPVSGPVWLHSHAYIGPSPDGDDFLQRLRVDGSFDVPAEHITDRSTEQSLSAFSQRAQGNKAAKSNASAPEMTTNANADALSSIQGPASIRNGIISSQSLKFKVAGAEANLQGTFHLHGQTVHLFGNLKMDTDISHATTGFKSTLLKPLTPFFKKRNAGAVVPINVSGNPGHYKVALDLSHGK